MAAMTAVPSLPSARFVVSGPRRALAVMAAFAVAVSTWLTVGALQAPTASARDTSRYIAAVAPMAQQGRRDHGVPASVSIAQSILESGWGTSSLAVYGQAYFGIKCNTSNAGSPYQSGCMNKNSLEYYDPANPVSEVSAFRIYKEAGDSFKDHGHFLRNNRRYAAAFSTNNPDDFIRAVHRAGYATDPNYANLIIGLMQRYDLYRYDRESASTTPVRVDGAIGDKYAQVGGASSALGVPIGEEIDGPLPGSRMTMFAAGAIVFTHRWGAHPISADLWRLYRSSESLRATIGHVKGDRYKVAGGWAQEFEHGRLYHTDRGTFAVFGAIYNRYAAVRADAGSLGVPTSNERCNLPGGGCQQTFTGGTITWSLPTGARATWGRISSRWDGMGREKSTLGKPVSDEICGLTQGGCYQNFSGGGITWTLATDAHPTYGEIRGRWAAMDYERSNLGYPTSGEFCGLRNGGCFQFFQGGTIYWSGPSGAWPAYGRIYDHWASTGWETGVFGYPTSAESCQNLTDRRVCTQTFQGGTITWDSQTDIRTSRG
ncbi:hypothetical protein CGZ92_02480 [Parenemella sanctibonifatiensis]|uniref:Mannosyl-glycoprotein endo-beta-N-acetylglucosamidase-like domain-containing protein n=2 Tax=Parenemella sanctibonifatiensis TaxID=2016505 RepID=A0A255EJ04_9ACTN|nr:hypothetical protein CGZ92_02480 [Parenemella sanctibonifatiensis]